MDIFICALSAAIGACAASIFFIAGLRTLRKQIEHLDNENKFLQTQQRKAVDHLQTSIDDFYKKNHQQHSLVDSKFEVLKEETAQCKARWLATTERLDAQGARILELEHRLQVSLPKLCDDED